jgi:photosystem II stability/assembly factor-like uncharacterized protein
MAKKATLILSALLLVLGACNSVSPGANLAATPINTSSAPVPAVLTTTTPLPPPDLPIFPIPTLVQIHFLDSTNGWGIAANESGAILRTVDGGETWLNTTPKDLTGIGYSTDLSVLNANTVWILVPNVDFYTGMLYHTSDGGLTWTSVAVPFGGANLQFLNESTGRALADRGAGMGSNSVEMYQSSDGGENWISVFNNDPTRPDSSGSLPLGGIKNGMTFLDANTGWVTGTRPVDGEIYLFVTHDGGATWSQQFIPLPMGYESYQYVPQAPVIFGNDGFLPLIIVLPGMTDFTFYTTQDGGTTWTGDPSNATRVISPGRIAFIDSQHGWSWDGGAIFYTTSDGGQIWGGSSTSLDLSGQLSKIEFVAGTTGGYTGWALTGVDGAGHSQLYQTTDNGNTWITLVP